MHRCEWACGSDLELEYHDREWGVPTYDERRLFEFLILEGAQAGLSWSTILKKRSGYRAAMADFDPQVLAGFSDQDIAALLANPGLVRNRLKIQAAVNNARAWLEVAATQGGFAAYLWRWVDGTPIHNAWRTLAEIPARTPLSDSLSKDLQRRGFKFVGSTICYAYMQAVGLVNDHLLDCFRHREINAMTLSKGSSPIRS